MTAIYAAYLTVTVLGTLAAAAILLAIIAICAYITFHMLTESFSKIQKLVKIQQYMTEQEVEQAVGIIKAARQRWMESEKSGK